MDSRPTKRQKTDTLITGFSDGFAPSTTVKKKVVSRPPVFHSAFDDSDKGKGKAKEVARPVTPKPKPPPAKLVSVRDIHKSFDLDLLPPSAVSSAGPSKGTPVKHPPAGKPRSVSRPNLNLKPLSSAGPSTVDRKRLEPPAFPTTKPLSSSSTRKPLVPPSPPRPRKADKDVTMQSMSATVLGKMSDLSSDTGDELAAILLKSGVQLDSGEAPDGSLEGATRRGLDVSPEKKGKGGSKFKKGGLAARASELYKTTQSGDVLWQKSVQQGRKIPADLTATILKVVHKPAPSQRKSASLSGIALCRIQGDTFDPYELYHIFFTSTSPTHQLEENHTLKIYRPWVEHNSEESIGPVARSLPMPMISGSPLSTADLLGSAPISKRWLFCGRFIDMSRV